MTIKEKSSSAKAIADKIEKALDKVRPSLEADGGGVELVGFDEKTGVAQVKLLGMCSGCPMAQMTLKQGIEAEVVKQVPEVKEVIGV
jgi:Fe-S cluster biogenesis protein NfuA